MRKEGIKIMNDKIEYIVRFNVWYSDETKSANGAYRCHGRLFIKATNVREALDISERHLTNFCGDKIKIESVSELLVATDK